MNIEETRKITLSLIDTFNEASRLALSLREVGLKKSNNWEIYDIYGLISEWCQDNFRTDYSIPSRQAAYTDSTEIYSVRGGSWFTESDSTRSSSRSYANFDKSSDGIGIRLVWEPI